MLDRVRAVLIDVLNLHESAKDWDADTVLLGNVPELDSLAVINLITALEDRFGITIDDDEVSGEIFATLGNLVDFIAAKTGD